LAAAEEAAGKFNLLRDERTLRRDGILEVRHLRQSEEISPWLEQFFAQHEARWNATAWPSLFRDPAQRDFYRRLTSSADETDWLRFTVVLWNTEPVAFHFGFCHRGTFLWYKPTFDIALAKRSPGKVLLRHGLLAAAQEGAHTFDLGLGDENFKRHFANSTRVMRTWGIYPNAGKDGTPQ
jgi:CelD/BcsL family acetyltransferase involved in cellulose biosynthesis